MKEVEIEPATEVSDRAWFRLGETVGTLTPDNEAEDEVWCRSGGGELGRTLELELEWEWELELELGLGLVMASEGETERINGGEMVWVGEFEAEDGLPALETRELESIRASLLGKTKVGDLRGLMPLEERVLLLPRWRRGGCLLLVLVLVLVLVLALLTVEASEEFLEWIPSGESA